MSKDAFIRARIESSLKVPLDLRVPNATTARTIKEARKGKGVVVCVNADEMFNKLGI